MDLTWMLVGVLGVWRLTHLLAEEKGPWDAMVRLRALVGKGRWGGLMDCFNCLSVWIAIPFALAVGEKMLARLLLWPALSGGAILLQRATAGPPAATYVEDREDTNELLR
jgi:hypothetical protein